MSELKRKLLFVDNYKIAHKINIFLDGPLYPIYYALVVTVCHCLGLEVVSYYFTAVFFLWVCLFKEDARGLLPLFIMGYFMVSYQNSPFNGSDYYFKSAIFIQLCITSCIMIAALLFRLVVYGGFYRMVTQKSQLAIGIIAFALAYLLNGVGSEKYSYYNILFALAVGGVLFLFFQIARNDMKEEGLFKYFAWCCVCAIVVVCVQEGILYLTKVKIEDGSIIKESISTGWGIWNMIGFYLVFFLPFVFYFASTSRFGWAYYILAVIAMIALVFTLGRGPLLVGILVFLFGVIYICIKSKTKKINRWITLIGIIGVIGLGIVFREKIMNMLQDYINRGLSDNGRFSLYQLAWQYFLQRPFFGVGLYYADLVGSITDSFGVAFVPSFYHNTILQLLATGGIITFLCYLFHRIQTFIVFLKNPSQIRIFLFVCVVSFLAMNLVDNHLFYFVPTYLYAFVLGIAEQDFIKTKDKKI